MNMLQLELRAQLVDSLYIECVCSILVIVFRHGSRNKDSTWSRPLCTVFGGDQRQVSRLCQTRRARASIGARARSKRWRLWRVSRQPGDTASGGLCVLHLLSKAQQVSATGRPQRERGARRVQGVTLQSPSISRPSKVGPARSGWRHLLGQHLCHGSSQTPNPSASATNVSADCRTGTRADGVDAPTTSEDRGGQHQ
jgi:hypothetical protein